MQAPSDNHPVSPSSVASKRDLPPSARPTRIKLGRAPVEQAKVRLVLAMVLFTGVYALIAGRLVHLGFTPDRPSIAYRTAQDAISAARPDVTDRNGLILATDLKTYSLYAEPRRILDVNEAIISLMSVITDLQVDSTRRKLESGAGFVWLKREITPEQRDAVHHLGIPGIGFLTENRRFYPGGQTASHIIGHVDVDNRGIAGLEKFIDKQGLRDLHAVGLGNQRDMKPVRLSVDLRVQHVVRKELSLALERYRAIAGVGIVLDAKTGEVVAMSSLPDYDPNDPIQALDKTRMNRATAGVYEMGSVFKTFTTAMALDSGQVTMDDRFDVRKPIRVARQRIDDFHGKRRILSVPEVFIYSSNIGTAKMALEVGIEGHKEFLGRIGMLDRVKSELPELALPLKPQKWTQLGSMTISFGHGLSVTPMHTAAAAAALLNGGIMIPPTFVARDKEKPIEGKRVVSEQTSAAMRYLFRLNSEKGSGRKAEVDGYLVGGKTGTAEKIENGRYSRDKRFNSFLAAFPMDDPQYVVLVVLDEPKPEEGKRYATAGWNTAPTTANIVRRIAPMLGVKPQFGKGSETIMVSY